jgi:proline iminopeptidase
LTGANRPDVPEGTRKAKTMKLAITLGKIMLAVVAALAAMVIVAYLLTFPDHAVPQTVAQDPSIPHITLNGSTFHAETFGQAANPVVIAVHGGPGGDYRSMLALQALSDQYFVVFFDQRGTGLSPRVNPEEVTLASALADLDAIVDHYGQGRQVNLVGHSWGAMLASAYLGQHPEKVDHAVLAEPGFLTSALAQEWAAATATSYSPSVLFYLAKTQFEALHVRGPDDQAADDYLAFHMNLYQGSDHPMAGYRCDGGRPSEDEGWRNGARVAGSLVQQAVAADGKFSVNFVQGVEQFTNKVLFMASECNAVIGAAWQSRQMEFFTQAELAVVPDAGHEMFAENPEASVAAVRAYLGAPAR